MILNKQQIMQAIDAAEVINSMEEGFALFSKGQANIPPFGSLHFNNPPGTVHIKHGHIKGSDNYVVKIASGFYENPKIGIPSSQGLMLLFDSRTGQLKAILLDEAYLTEIRTAAAGALAAKYFAPKNVSCIGIVGTGTQAFHQLNLLKHAVACKDVIVWGRSLESLQSFTSRNELSSFRIKPTLDVTELTANCNLIVTTTPSKSPLIFANRVQPGTHITAVGADGGGKIELEPKLFSKADIVCVDSRDQCFLHGDVAFALKEGLIGPEKVIELGEAAANPALRRKNDREITVVDLTGVAIQDIQIANAVYTSSSSKAPIRIDSKPRD
jgi:ornithine cyclodeaminase